MKAETKENCYETDIKLNKQEKLNFILPQLTQYFPFSRKKEFQNDEICHTCPTPKQLVKPFLDSVSD